MARNFVLPLLAAGLALCGLPAAAAPKPPPPDLFAIYKSVCIDHQGDLAGARDAALALGLTRYQPSGAPAGRDDEGSFIPASDRPDGKITWYIAIGRPDVKINGGELTSCQFRGADPGNRLYKAALAWPGSSLTGERMPGNKVSFMYRQTADGRVPLGGDRETPIEPVVKAGELRVFDVEYGPTGTLINLVTGAPPKT